MCKYDVQTIVIDWNSVSTMTVESPSAQFSYRELCQHDIRDQKKNPERDVKTIVIDWNSINTMTVEMVRPEVESRYINGITYQ